MSAPNAQTEKLRKSRMLRRSTTMSNPDIPDLHEHLDELTTNAGVMHDGLTDLNLGRNIDYSDSYLCYEAAFVGGIGVREVAKAFEQQTNVVVDSINVDTQGVLFVHIKDVTGDYSNE